MTDHTDCPECAKRTARELATAQALQSTAAIKCQVIADCLNRLRIAPRILVIAYGYICWLTFEWFTGLGAESTTQHVAFASTIWGAAAVWFGFYVNSGNTAPANNYNRFASNPSFGPGGFGGQQFASNNPNPGGFGQGGYGQGGYGQGSYGQGGYGQQVAYNPQDTGEYLYAKPPRGID